MKIAAVFAMMACTVAHCNADESYMGWNDASVRLSDLAQTKTVGLINIAQPATERPDRVAHVLGELAGLPAGKYVGIIHSINGTCQNPGPMFQMYDKNIKGDRPVVLFFNRVDELNRQEFAYFVKNIALDRDQVNNVMLRPVLVYRIPVDSRGPLNEYFEPKGPTPVACGIIARGHIEPHVFQIPTPEN